MSKAILCANTVFLCLAQHAAAIHPSLAKMNRAAGDGSNFSGSCVLIGKMEKTEEYPSVALWATAAHVIRDGVGKPWVQVRGGTIYRSSGVVVWRPVEDFAVVVTSADRLQVEPVPIAQAPTGPVVHEGFGGGRWRTTTGRFLRYWSSMGSRTRDVGNWTTTVISGDSGGPIFNSSGQLVGIVTGGSGPGDTMGPHCGVIRRVLRAVTFPLRTRAGGWQRVQASCEGSYCQVQPIQIQPTQVPTLDPEFTPMPEVEEHTVAPILAHPDPISVEPEGCQCKCSRCCACVTKRTDTDSEVP